MNIIVISIVSHIDSITLTCQLSRDFCSSTTSCLVKYFNSFTLKICNLFSHVLLYYLLAIRYIKFFIKALIIFLSIIVWKSHQSLVTPSHYEQSTT